MTKYTFKSGDRVEISTPQVQEGESKTFISQIHEVESDTTLLLYTPIHRGRLVALERADYALLFLFDDNLVKFEASASERLKLDGFNLLRFRLRDEGVKVQRRQFYRFECVLPMKFALVSQKAKASDTPPMMDAVVRDLSGGGMRFVSNESLDPGDNIKCILILGREYIFVVGNVLRRDDIGGENMPYDHEYRLIFAGILPDEQEKIVRYIFQEQRKYLQRLPD